MHNHSPASIAAEIGALLLVAGGWLQYLPLVATLLGIVWYSFNIYDWIIERRLRHKPPVKEPGRYTALDEENPDTPDC